MADKPVPLPAPDDETKDVLDMMNLEGRHTGHSLTRVGAWWLCSCSKEVQRVA